MRAPAVVGSWPEPFLHDYQDQRWSVGIFCGGGRPACGEVDAVFSGLGIDIGKGGTMQPIGGNLGGMEHSWLIGLGDGIWVKNFQPAGSSGSPPPAAADGWVQSNGAARRIAVGTRGRPWVVNSAGNIYRRLEL